MTKAEMIARFEYHLEAGEGCRFGRVTYAQILTLVRCGVFYSQVADGFELFV